MISKSYLEIAFFFKKSKSYEKTQDSCRDNTAICDSNANCVFDPNTNDFVCKCNSGFEGNGLRGKCFVDESYGMYLVYAQGPSLHKIPLKPTEEDLSSPGKNRIVHIPGK